MGSFLLGIGIDILKGYLGDLLEFGCDSVIGWVDDLTKKYGEKDVLSSFPEIYNSIYNNIINNFDVIIEENKINYEDTQIFQKLDKDKIIEEINQLIQELNFENDIKKKAKNIYSEKAQIGKEFGLLNILVKGDNEKINKFIEIFKINKNNKNEYYFNNEINNKNEIIEKNELKVLKNKIKQIRLYDKNNVNNNNIDCIWEFIEVSKKDITNSPNTSNTTDTPNTTNTPNKSNDIPIIYIYFKDDLDLKLVDIFSNLNKSVDNLNKNRLFTNHIIDNNDKKYLFDLFEKTVLNIIITKFKTDIENKSNEIRKEIFTQNRQFSFGNEIDSLYIMNLQIIQTIFKKFIGKRLPDSIKNIIKGYQDNISINKKVFLSDIFYKIIPIIKNILVAQKQSFEFETCYKKEENNRRQLKIEIINKTILILNELKYIDDNDNGKKKGDKNIKVKSMKIDSINTIIQTKLEDYFLRKASQYINELIINTLQEKIIDVYSNRIITNYFKNHRNELVFIDCKECKEIKKDNKA